MNRYFKKGVALLVAFALLMPTVFAATEGGIPTGELCPVCGVGEVVQMEGQNPTYTNNGWEPYERCDQEDCSYTTYTPIPALGEPQISDFEDFILNLNFLEVLAQMYIMENPGNDPLELVIKYIRTGVDRYNSGSWGIMAGYEDAEFAKFVRATEHGINIEAESVDEYVKFTGLKNIKSFDLPNGDKVDFGHMFGTMDISYTNKDSENHADVGGWAGDLVDLITSADADELSGTVDELIPVLKESYFLKNPQPNDVFSLSDFYGDLDAYYVLNTVLERGYSMDYETETGMLTTVMMEYFTPELTTGDRAEYFLKKRLGNAGTREQVRRAVYNAYTGNKTVTTLEATRAFLTDQNNINNLRKASCYVFADYICSLAGDYVEVESNPYFATFSTEAQSLAPGVTQETNYATTADGKQIVYYLATADLSNPDVEVYANYNQNDPTLGWNMSRVLDQANAAQAKYGNPESEKYIENYQVVAAINADGYDMKTGEPGGLLVMNGTEHHPINASGFFGITKEGKAVIGTTADYNSTYKGQLRDGVGAFGVTLVKDGKIAVSPSAEYYNNRASRTAVGITKTGKVVFMVLDGRQEPFSCGGSMEEIAQIMLEAGCYTAVNLDGGGSTTYVSKPEGATELQVTSSPSDGYARSVSTSLMMVSTAPSSTKFHHARINSDYSFATLGTPIKLTPVGLSATGNTVDLPENCTWMLASGEETASVTEDGVFTATEEREYDIQLMAEGAVIGQKTITVASPDNVYFERKTLDGVYEATIDIPVAAVCGGNKIAINENDVKLSVSPASAGTFQGFSFKAGAESNIKSVVITAALSVDNSITSTMTVNLYRQGENTFDFHKATGGDRQLAWDRQVSNATSDDAITYIAEDPDEDMTTSYIFAIDMREIPIPEQLSDLTYMLPGANDVDASAWNFLLQLAERVSVLTEVKPVLKFDPRFDIDYSEIEVINDYFYLDGCELNEEENQLTATLKWHDQTAAIKAETANPLCMLKGIKLTPKDGMWADMDKINAVNSGNVGYKIYLRANALYTFAKNPENQEIFGLKEFENPEVIIGGSTEKGGYFESVYKEFEDRYTLSVVKKNGWLNEDGGFAYYVDGVRLTGVAFADGFYYDFGEDGINVGQQKYTGFMEQGGKTYYIRLGEMIKNAWQLVGSDMYHFHEDGDAHRTAVQNPITCTKGGKISYTCTECREVHKSVFILPEGHEWDENYKCRICEKEGKDINHATIGFGTVSNPRDPNAATPRYEKTAIGVRPTTHITFDGVTALSWSNDANVDPVTGEMRNVYVSWVNDGGIGKAYINFRGKGDYYGEAPKKLEYIILPASVTSLTANAGVNTVTLSWPKAQGAGYYRIYRMNANGSRTKIGETTSTSYTVEGLSADTTYTYSVASSAVSTDGEEKTYNCARWADVTFTTKALPGTEDMLKDIRVIFGGQEIKMLSENGVNYIMLPGDFADELEIRWTADGEVSGQTVTVSGDAESTLQDGKVMLLLAEEKTGDYHKVNLTVGEMKPMEIRFMQGAEIPAIFITSDNAEKGREYVDSVKGNKATATMQMVDNSGEIVYNVSLKEIKARGNSTFAHFHKKSYQIKLDAKADLLGINQQVKTWVLLANYADATMMHDKTMKDFAQYQMGMDYVADSNWVNLWYDGEFRGTYLLGEKNSVGSTSVDITDMEAEYEDLNAGYGENMSVKSGENKYGMTIKYTEGLQSPADLTGGYLIELNHNYIDEANGFITRKGKGFNIKSPEWLGEDAVKYISEYYQEFEDAVYATDGKGAYTGYNQSTGKYFYDYVDLDSLVKMFIIQELGLNPDGFISSLYFHKDAGGKMFTGPVWDQDLTFGTGWNKYIDETVEDYHYLAEALFRIPAFRERLAEYFEAETVADVEKMISDIGAQGRLLAENAKMNYVLWPYIRVGNPEKADHIWNGADYESVVEDMQTWLGNRLEILKDRFIPRFEMGDANCDGRVNSDDAVLILRYVVGFKDANFNPAYGDINGDGRVNSDDSVAILRKVVGLE